MNAKQREEFINKECQDNITWAAQQMLEQLPPKQRYQIIWALRKLHKTLQKEWARDLSLTQLIVAADMISPSKEGQGALAE
jgi:hypothetical protein